MDKILISADDYRGLDNIIDKTETACFDLIHKLVDTGYKSKRAQVKDMLLIGEHAKTLNSLYASRGGITDNNPD